MAKTIRIHLGSGVHKWPNNWINVDSNGNPDILASVDKLPFEDGEVSEITAIHLFEHLHRFTIDEVLKEWCRILTVGGKLSLEMPSMDKIADMIAKGEDNIRLTLLGIFGDPRDPKPDMLHKWCWTNKELSQVLTSNGFKVEFKEPIFHISKRDLRVEGIKL